MNPSRIKPPMNEDNGWWWAEVARGRLPLQRCKACNKLRHPPRPMCPACRSMTWDSIEAAGRGTLHTYTVLHHPRFPGYEYPLTIAIVELEEGERICTQLVDCARDAIEIDMKLEMIIHEDADGFKLPMCRPAL